MLRVIVVAIAGAVFATPAGGQQVSYERASSGTRVLEAPSGLSIRVLVEAAVLGGSEVELAEITFPGGTATEPRPHTHGAIEILYIVSGELDHVVNGESYHLTEGDVGIVRPGDSVAHRVVGERPVKALVVWVPGGEADRLARFFSVRPLDR